MKNILSIIFIILLSSCSTIYYKGCAFDPVYSHKPIDTSKSTLKVYSPSEIGISSKNNLSSKNRIIGYTKRKVTKKEKATAIGILSAGAAATAIAAVVIPVYLFYIIVTNSEHPKN